MRINTSDLPVKMAFQVSNLHNSVTALGEGGAEKLRGQGDMLFKMNGKIQHLQGAFISPDEIDSILNWVRQRFEQEISKTPEQHQSFYWHFPQGINGFTIADADLERTEDMINGEQALLPRNSASRRWIKQGMIPAAYSGSTAYICVSNVRRVLDSGTPSPIAG